MWMDIVMIWLTFVSYFVQLNRCFEGYIIPTSEIRCLFSVTYRH